MLYLIHLIGNLVLIFKSIKHIKTLSLALWPQYQFDFSETNDTI